MPGPLNPVTEPVRLHSVQTASVIALVTATLGLIAAFGVAIPAAVPGAVVAFVAAAMVLYQGFYRTLPRVTPEFYAVDDAESHEDLQPGKDDADTVWPDPEGFPVVDLEEFPVPEEFQVVEEEVVVEEVAGD